MDSSLQAESRSSTANRSARSAFGIQVSVVKASRITSRINSEEAVGLSNLLARWKLSARSRLEWFKIVACRKLASMGSLPAWILVSSIIRCHTISLLGSDIFVSAPSSNKKFNGNLNADRAATIALYHEASETRYGDIVSPTKYANEEIAYEFKKIEALAEQECLDSLPEELRDVFEDLIIQDNVDSEYKAIVKAADIMVAYVKSLDEINHNNPEFTHVEKRLKTKLDSLTETMPEVEYFMTTFLRFCTATVDKLSKHSWNYTFPFAR